MEHCTVFSGLPNNVTICGEIKQEPFRESQDDNLVCALNPSFFFSARSLKLLSKMIFEDCQNFRLPLLDQHAYFFFYIVIIYNLYVL